MEVELEKTGEEYRGLRAGAEDTLKCILENLIESLVWTPKGLDLREKLLVGRQRFRRDGKGSGKLGDRRFQTPPYDMFFFFLSCPIQHML